MQCFPMATAPGTVNEVKTGAADVECAQRSVSDLKIKSYALPFPSFILVLDAIHYNKRLGKCVQFIYTKKPNYKSE